ncbi:hypothetical protein GVX82_02620 [Patescibacteria group bacterium]|jgi:hypothetical protein|nr:hypothetical protein [Patescibacteria group bacterium]
MENRSSQIWTTIIVAGVVAVAAYWIGSNQAVNNPTFDVKTGSSVKAANVSVGTFYDGKEGYSVSIPSGNTSTCLWNYTDGNAAIPYLETTNARSATEKHTIYSYTGWDWQVLCADDFGNYYTGTFQKAE